MSTPTETAPKCMGLQPLSSTSAVHCPGCAALATLQAENAELRERLGATERDLAKPENWPIEALNETNALFDRARAAEGERDRLRALLERCCLFIPEKGAIWGDVNAALAAIPHTEGEASAPPKETR